MQRGNGVLPRFLKRRVAAALAALFLCISLVAACDPTPEAETPIPTVSIGGPQNISMLVLLAQQQGLFDRHHVRVTYQPLQNGKISFDTVASGQINMATLVDANLAFLGFEGARGVTVLASIMSKTDDAIVARADRGIRRPQDLAGRRIAYLPGTSSNVLLRRFQTHHRIDLSRATLVSMSPPAMQAAIINGDVDAISVWQPFRFNAMANLGAGGVQFDNGGVYRGRVYIVARAADASARADSYRRVLGALSDAAAYARANPDAAIDFLARELGVERTALARAWDEYELDVSPSPDTAAHLTAIGRDIVALEPEFSSRAVPDYSAFWSAELQRQLAR